MKKIFSIMLTLLFTIVISTGAFAHGGHSSGHNTKVKENPKHEICSVEDCTETAAHQHGDNWYCSGSVHDGRYKTCGLSDCTELGLHQHKGVYYSCQHKSTGKTCC